MSERESEREREVACTPFGPFGFSSDLPLHQEERTRVRAEATLVKAAVGLSRNKSYFKVSLFFSSILSLSTSFLI